MPQTCPSGSPMREEGFDYGVASKDWTGTEMPSLPEEYAASFVRDTIAYSDVCKNREFSSITCIESAQVGANSTV